MKKTGLMLFALSMLFVACEKDMQKVTFNYPVTGNYYKLDVEGAFDVTLSETATKIEVTASEDMQKYVDIYVKDGALKIRYRWNLSLHNRDAKVVLPADASIREVELSGAATFRGDLTGREIDVELSGASDFYGTVQATNKVELDLSGSSYFGGAIQGPEVSIDLSGASDIEGSIDADNIDVDASGSSTVKVTGSCLNYLDLDLSGSSDFLAPTMECRNVGGEMSGSSDAEFQVCENLQVSLSGSSRIVYGIPVGCTPTVRCSTLGRSSVNTR